MKTRFWIALPAQVILAALFAFMGFLKISGDPSSVHLFSVLGMEPQGRWLIGVLELGSALLLLFPSTVPRGAFLALCVLTGAFLAHLTHIGFAGDMWWTSILWGIGFSLSVLLLLLHRKRLPFFSRALDR